MSKEAVPHCRSVSFSLLIFRFLPAPEGNVFIYKNTPATVSQLFSSQQVEYSGFVELFRRATACC